MTVTDNNQDTFERYYFKCTGVKKLQEIYDYFGTKWSDYKFAMLIGEPNSEEIEEVGNTYNIYFLDEIKEEVLSYCDYTYNSELNIWYSRYERSEILQLLKKVNVRNKEKVIAALKGVLNG